MYIYTSLYIYAPGAVSGGVEECTLNTRLLVVVRLFIGTQNRLVALHSALFPRLT